MPKLQGSFPYRDQCWECGEPEMFCICEELDEEVGE